MGETFEGQVILERGVGTIQLLEPYDSMTTEFFNKFLWTPINTGVFEFKGKISIDGDDYPFDWKFIVVRKGQRKNKFEFVRKVRIWNSAI